ncbi:type VII secretion protein EsaA [Streptococcus oricebi]|uniref:Type VII secretion system accessory factor EsaA n=1 Tax=Streptococcus oricebi TaxID=1547447 RepID=A0ABS5B6F3_9STRE|nr:type VII secretion protein EsaA [Streptococcus oricebi]MBP2624321.1 type VII secretion protein EsaA [Streptococcus oricebi]
MKNRILKYVGNAALIAVLLISVIGLNIIVQNNTRTNNEKKLKQSQATRLNVALVNEDRAVVADDREYNLGASYIKNIERDNSQNWSVVSRGSAEKGLKDGKYQLMVTIPNDFSSKVLDINSVQADRADIRYKVNAKGNLQVENDANKLAKDIVADLNKQLVDLYIASILSNLYTAQQNVQTISGVQTTNIGSYRNDLLQSALGARNFFPSLASMSNSSLTANTSLKSSLESYSNLYDSLDKSQTDYGKSLEELIKARANGKTSFEEFVTAVIGINNLSGQTQALYEKVQTTQDNLNVQITGSSLTNQQKTNEKNYTDLLANLDSQIAELKASIKTEDDKRSQQEQELTNFVNDWLAKKYPKDNQNQGQESTVTLKQFLGEEKAKQLLEESSKGAVEEIDILGKMPSADLRENLNALQGNLGEIDVSGTKNATVTITVPDGVTLKSWKINNDNIVDNKGELITTVTKDLTGSFTVSYVIEGTVPADSQVTVSVNGKEVGSQKVSELKAYKDYTAQVQKVMDAYEAAESVLDVLYPKNDSGKRNSQALSDFLEQPVTPLLVSLLKQAITDNVNKYKGTSPEETLQKLEASRDGLKTNLEEIKKTNDNLTSQITQDLDSLKKLQEQANSKKQGVDTEWTSTDSQLSALEGGLKSLVAQTSSAKSSSQSNIEQANSVNSIFSSFDKELETVKGNSEKLSTDAEGLMAKFEQELATNGDFVSSFIKVLNNAYKDGVPNETLMSFLASPVAQSASSVRATVNVYRPFTWILLLEVVALFTAYLFATQNIVGKMKDRFKLDKLEETDIVTVAILSGLSLVIGLAIGIISSSRLYVEKAYIPSWVLLVVLASFVLVQGQYLLLKHLKSIGMGLAFFMIISFVYLSNAIGTTASLTGLSALIKTFNILSILESGLSGYFDGRTVGVFMIGALIVLIIALTAVNIFVNKKPKMVEEGL